MNHTYTLNGVIRGNDIRTKTFASRSAAEDKMFSLFDKNDLQLADEIKDSKHCRTYRCEEPSTWFHINRVD